MLDHSYEATIYASWAISTLDTGHSRHDALYLSIYVQSTRSCGFKFLIANLKQLATSCYLELSSLEDG